MEKRRCLRHVLIDTPGEDTSIAVPVFCRRSCAIAHPTVQARSARRHDSFEMCGGSECWEKMPAWRPGTRITVTSAHDSIENQPIIEDKVGPRLPKRFRAMSTGHPQWNGTLQMQQVTEAIAKARREMVLVAVSTNCSRTRQRLDARHERRGYCRWMNCDRAAPPAFAGNSARIC